MLRTEHIFPQKVERPAKKAIKEAAKAVGVSPRSVERRKAVGGLGFRKFKATFKASDVDKDPQLR